MLKVLDYCNKGLPITLNIPTKEIIYKDNVVPFEHIRLAIKSGRSRVQLKENLFFTSQDDLIEFGCLTLTKEKVNNLIKDVCKILKT